MQRSATVALICNNKLLLLKRGSGAKWNPDKYCLPGGGCGLDESLVFCAKRELYEETGINIDVSLLNPLTITYPKYSKTVFVHTSDIFYPVRLNYEHSQYVWSCSNELENQYVPGLITTIKTLENHKYLNYDNTNHPYPYSVF